MTCYTRAMGALAREAMGTVSFGWCDVKGQGSSKEVSIESQLLYWTELGVLQLPLPPGGLPTQHRFDGRANAYLLFGTVRIKMMMGVMYLKLEYKYRYFASRGKCFPILSSCVITTLLTLTPPLLTMTVRINTDYKLFSLSWAFCFKVFKLSKN